MIPDSDHLLKVLYYNRHVGTIYLLENGRLAFSYSDEWLIDTDSWPISRTIPMCPGTNSHEFVQRFFANLLPEGRLRYLVCRRLGISEENDFELLKAIGGECAGALAIVPIDWGEAELEKSGYREISTDELANLEHTGLVYPVFAHDGPIRLSLAGAQDKLPVLCKNGKIYIPVGNSPSSHILKFPNRDFKYLPENEVFTAWFANEMGLPVVSAELISIGNIRVCKVRRYDRLPENDGIIKRVHQEDFCQALGFSSQRKYEIEGGPSFSDCFSLATEVADNPLTDTETLIRWHIFNVLVGNADGHAKNLSLVYRDKNSKTLAPFYDLVCTAIYPRLDLRIAMSVGGCFDTGQLTEKYWKDMAEAIGVRYSFLQNMIRTMISVWPERIESVSGKFREMYGDHPVIGRIKAVINKRSRRISHLIK